jgi:hypothetical protein
MIIRKRQAGADPHLKDPEAPPTVDAVERLLASRFETLAKDKIVDAGITAVGSAYGIYVHVLILSLRETGRRTGSGVQAGTRASV